MTLHIPNSEIAAALAAADWSGVSLKQKLLIGAAIASLSGASEPRTMRDQLRQAYPEHFARIEGLTKPDKLDGAPKMNAGEALGCAFTWADTDEGHEFWCDLAKRYDSNWW